MLRTVSHLKGATIEAMDGDIGSVADAYFDDEQWAVRYLVVDTGMWLGWHVLIAPQSVVVLDWDRSLIEVSLTRNQVEQSPRADLQHQTAESFTLDAALEAADVERQLFTEREEQRHDRVRVRPAEARAIHDHAGHQHQRKQR